MFLHRSGQETKQNRLSLGNTVSSILKFQFAIKEILFFFTPSRSLTITYLKALFPCHKHSGLYYQPSVVNY